MGIQHKAWTGFLFLLSFTYLLFELAFNSRIVDGAFGEFDALQLEVLEYQGRILSGIGFSLLLLRLISPAKTKGFILYALLLSLAGFSFMFFGQKYLIDTLVNSSYEEERVDAMHIALLKKGITNNTLQLDDIEIPKDQVDTPETKAMLSIVGAMIFNSSSFITHLKDNVDEIIDQIAELEARKTFSESYEGYKEYQQTTVKLWSDYAEGANQYLSAKNKAKQNALSEADKIYLDAANQYAENQVRLSKQEKIQKSLEIKRGVSDYFEAKRKADIKCNGSKISNEKCHIKIEQIYRDNVIKHAGRFVAPDYWCYPPEKKRITETIRGRSRIVVKTITDCNTMTREYIEEKFTALINSGNQSVPFLDNPKVAKAVLKKLSRQGVKLPSKWTLRDKQALVNALEKKASGEIEKRYRTTVTNKVGRYLSPHLTQKKFLNHPLIQDPIKKKLEHKGKTDISLNLAPEKFFKQLHKPKYIDLYQEQKDELSRNGEFFGDNERFEARGKDYYRSIVVPPLAMAFSLLFGLLNLMAFVKTFLQLALPPKLAQASAIVAMASIFVAIPLLQPSDTVKSKAFQYFQLQLTKDYPSILAHLSAWVVDTQPMVYPMGHYLAVLVRQEVFEDILRDHLRQPHHPPANKKLNVAAKPGENPKQEYLFLAKHKIQKAATTKPKKVVQQSKASNKSGNSAITYLRQSEPSGKLHAYSTQLAINTLSSGKGLMVDVSPIGRPRNENWVVYDKPVLGKNICIPGLKQTTNLRNMSPSQWRAGFLGSCNTSGKVKPLPSIESYFTRIKGHAGKPMIISLQEDLSGEVFCNRYSNLVGKLSKWLKNSKFILSTPSISILGCLSDLHRQYDIAFELPLYSNAPGALRAKNHKAMTRAEWGRLKAAEKGLKPTLSAIDSNDLKKLLSSHDYIDALLIDSRLITARVKNIVGSHKVATFLIEGNTIKGQK